VDGLGLLEWYDWLRLPRTEGNWRGTGKRLPGLELSGTSKGGGRRPDIDEEASLTLLEYPV
jgi:hypothetical protein